MTHPLDDLRLLVLANPSNPGGLRRWLDTDPDDVELALHPYVPDGSVLVINRKRLAASIDAMLAEPIDSGLARSSRTPPPPWLRPSPPPSDPRAPFRITGV